VKMVGSGGQQVAHYLYDASGVIVAGGTAQLVLARAASRTYLELQNLSTGPLYYERGAAIVKATITNGAVTSFTISNPGFNFTQPPILRLLGGGNDLGGPKFKNSSYLGLNQPGGSSPSNPATAVCVMASATPLPGLKISSITITNPGAGYAIAPYVLVQNNDLDPYGVATPTQASSGLLTAGSPPLIWNGTTCITDPIAILGAQTNQAFLCKWMD
jgi:hypothetical protein